MTPIGFTQRVSPLITDPQQQFVTLLKEITNLQWVRESLPIQSKYYDDLKEQQERETHLKGLLEKQIQEHRKKQDTFTGLLKLKRNTSSSNNDNKAEPSYSELVERLRRCDGKLKAIETQLRSTDALLQHLKSNKDTLDTHCLNLHRLYDRMIPDMPVDPAHVIERHLKGEVLQLANDIPQIERDIDSQATAQKKLYESRDLMERAMMTLPGATTFLDRQVLAGHGNNATHSRFMKSSTLSSKLDIMVPTFKDAEKLASEAYKLERCASKLCNDIPLIPSSSFNKVDNVMTVLTAYRGYRLKVETILRSQLNPRLNKLQSQLAITKYHHEQRSIEWIEQQIIILEDYLRRNGYLRNVNLDREISMLRMGSNGGGATIILPPPTTTMDWNGRRMTVDNALDVAQSNIFIERNGDLPEYSANPCGDYTIQHPSSATIPINNNSTRSSSNSLLSSLPRGSVSPLMITTCTHSIPTPRISLENAPLSASASSPSSSNMSPSSSSTSSTSYYLPAYSDHHRLEYRGPESPPAYSR